MNFIECPFCGADEFFLRVVDPYGENDEFCVICDFCDSYGPDASTEEDALKKWNRREI